MPGKPTGKSDRRAAEHVADDWLRDGIPEAGGKRSRPTAEAFEISALLQAIRKAPLTSVDAEGIVRTLKERELVGRASRRFIQFSYRTRSSWTHSRRVVGKAEYMDEGENPRFVVTNLSSEEYQGQELYEKVYCARGEMENRIKQQQLHLFADRTSSANDACKSNTLVVLLSSSVLFRRVWCN